MLVVETIAKIRRDHLVRGVPIKKIARDLRVSKNTVRKVVRGDETSFSYERKIQPMPKLGPWVEELERQLKANEKKARKDRLSLLRIHEDLVSLALQEPLLTRRRPCLRPGCHSGGSILHADWGRVGGVVTEPLPSQTRASGITALGSSHARFAQAA